MQVKKNRLEKYVMKEEDLVHKKARIRWVKELDGHSKTFSQSSECRKGNSLMNKLERERISIVFSMNFAKWDCECLCEKHAMFDPEKVSILENKGLKPISLGTSFYIVLAKRKSAFVKNRQVFGFRFGRK